MEVQLQLKPGGAMGCPACGRQNTLNGLDGDTVFTSDTIPAAKVVAQGRALARRPLLFRQHRSVRLR